MNFCNLHPFRKGRKYKFRQKFHGLQYSPSQWNWDGFGVFSSRVSYYRGHLSVVVVNSGTFLNPFTAKVAVIEVKVQKVIEVKVQNLTAGWHISLLFDLELEL